MAKPKKSKNKKTKQTLDIEQHEDAAESPVSATEEAPPSGSDEKDEPEILPEMSVEEAFPEEQAAPTLEEQLAESQAEVRRSQDQVLRARADFDNYRKRMLREMDDVRKRAAETLLHDLLPILDNLERALDHADSDSSSLTEGIELIVKQFTGLLSQKGVEPIPAAGESFDPEVHEAVAHIESEDAPEKMITQEFMKGYTLAGRVLRPSKVVVSAGPPAKDKNELKSEPSELSDAANTE